MRRKLPDVYPAAPRVLVVDDDAVIRQLVVVNLELEGFEVHTAVDGVDALEMVREVRPQVITLDIMMPRMDGWDVATALREDPSTVDIRLIMLTARAQEADVKRGSRIGVDYYLTKPFDPDELITVVHKLAAGQPA
ncbi:Histidine kinase [Frankia canadensis]|uniref:Histidine kinase n=1 Tax=Frankia canadensis TaxID=1836972 RepID=A0A2I2KSC9_9ACTN|nr:response regulator [Frankia canadensis]SNQ48577.1 Histidine kinase [Frankia canadensis]SOU55867.1 Histidine kinase [Frankia canadensis]